MRNTVGHRRPTEKVFECPKQPSTATQLFFTRHHHPFYFGIKTPESDENTSARRNSIRFYDFLRVNDDEEVMESEGNGEVVEAMESIEESGKAGTRRVFIDFMDESNGD